MLRYTFRSLIVLAVAFTAFFAVGSATAEAHVIRLPCIVAPQILTPGIFEMKPLEYRGVPLRTLRSNPKLPELRVPRLKDGLKVSVEK